MEQRIRTPHKFQFPHFELTHWYAAPNVLKLLQDSLKQRFPPTLVVGVKAIIPMLKVWLTRSKQTDFDSDLLAPSGFNCQKLIKDLNKALKQAERKLEGHPIVKSRGKSYKQFYLDSDQSSFTPIITETTDSVLQDGTKKH